MRRAGFTLIEITVVLVIVSLIIGGVLAGQEMIRSSQLARVPTDVQRYLTAFNAFETKYSSAPGDFESAESYWGSPSSGTCANGTNAGTGTCNGNGDGYVGRLDGANPQCLESVRAWQHLALSGFAQGVFTGTKSSRVGTDYCAAKPGENVPAASTGEGAGYEWIGDVNQFAWTQWPFFYDSRVNILMLGSTNFNTGTTVYPAFSTGDAKSIDTKMDDGRPGTGKVISSVGSAASNPGCTTTDLPATSLYSTNPGIRCMLGFLK